MSRPAIRRRDRDAILQSLRAGVVPRRGHQHIQVGRRQEISALMEDLERVADGGAGVRFVIGEYGSGKTFFLFLIRAIALEKGLVTAHADLSPDRRLHASGGQARSLYSELMANLATRTKPEAAITSVVERFVTTARQQAREQGESESSILHQRLEQLSEMTGGYDFATVVEAYWKGHEEGDDRLQSDAVRWLRGEFATRTDARKALGVRTIIDDANFYDHLKLFARFCRLAGYDGLVVCLDEMVNLYKLHSGQARRNNYEQLLRIVNDSLQGSSVGLGFLLGGTPEFLMDTRKGLYSYEALRSRLATNRFATDGLQDLSGPVISLANLSQEELYLLLQNLLRVQAGGEDGWVMPEEGIEAFMRHCSEKIGDAYFRTPRNTIKEFLQLLAILEQNPGASWKDLIGEVTLEADEEPETADATGEDHDQDDDDALTSFRL